MFSEGLAAVQKNGKWGFINTAGKVVIPFKYDEALDFDDDIAEVMQGDKVFYIDKTGKLIE